MLCSRVLSSVLPAGPKGARRPRRGAASAPRAFHYDVQEMEDDEARRAREREAEDSALEDGVTIVGSSSSKKKKKKKKREKATMSAAGGAADVGVESKVEL